MKKVAVATHLFQESGRPPISFRKVEMAAFSLARKWTRCPHLFKESESGTPYPFQESGSGTPISFKEVEVAPLSLLRKWEWHPSSLNEVEVTLHILFRKWKLHPLSLLKEG